MDNNTFTGGPPIYEFTPGGVQIAFSASNLGPYAVAFDSGGDLFATSGSGSICEFTNGVATNQGIFASGFTTPFGLAFDSAGNLFVGENSSGTIYEFTNGVATKKGIFASGLSYPRGLAFNTAGDLFVANQGTGIITKITAGGVQSTFASGLENPAGLAFQPLPQLSIVLSRTNVILSWPTNAAGLTLQFTTNLLPAAWSTNLPAPTIINGQYTATNTISGTNRFYRLSK